MSLEESIYSKLSGNGTIAGLVGTRIWPVKMPDNPGFPCISFNRQSTIRDQTLAGRVSYCNVILQIDSWAETFDVCNSLASTIFALLEGFRGTILGIDIQGILSQNEVDLYDDDAQIFRRSQSFRITFLET
jgi:hypothetical protein